MNTRSPKLLITANATTAIMDELKSDEKRTSDPAKLLSQARMRMIDDGVPVLFSFALLLLLFQ